MKRALVAFAAISLAFYAVACSDEGDDSPATTGTGATPGTGGATPGTGGAMPGTGGAMPGTGGAMPGTGGAMPGTGGAQPGTGGAQPGTGGTTPGTGGAQPGTGGAQPGTGGTTPGTGGDGTGGTPVEEPTLILSGKTEGTFWKTDTPLTEGGTTATVTVNAANTHQTMHGFGGSFNEKGWVALMALSEADRALAMKLLFSPTEGANFWWGRIPMGASDYGTSAFTYDDIASGTDYDMAQFKIDRDKDPNKGIMPYIKAAQVVRNDIKFWGSPWTPPPWMKDNNAYNLGSMKNTPENLDAYAQYFVKFIQAYEAEGIHIHSVHPQNEPGWQQNYPTAAWGPATNSGTNAVINDPAFLGKFVVNNLAPAIQAAGLDTEIWYGTFSNDAHSEAYWNDLVSANGVSLIKGVGLQWNGKNIASAVRQANPNLLIMQSEHQCGNYPWVTAASSKEAADKTTFWAAEAPNNYNYAVETWELMKEWLTQYDVNIYSAWNMVLDTTGLSLDTVRPWPQNALLIVDTAQKKLIATPAYYVFRHFSQYLDDGAVRIDATGGDAVAFKNPDGDIVTVVHNGGNSPGNTVVSVSGKMYQVNIPAGGWATLNVKATN